MFLLFGFGEAGALDEDLVDGVGPRAVAIVVRDPVFLA